MGEQRVSTSHFINNERVYANSVVNNDMDRIIDIFFLHCPYAYDCQESTAYHRNDKMINTAKKSELKELKSN